jgi:hypothetical protein
MTTKEFQNETKKLEKKMSLTTYSIKKMRLGNDWRNYNMNSFCRGGQ